MIFTLARQAETDCSTWSILRDDDGIEICRFLERGLKNPDGHPRIPAGTYQITRKPVGASHFDHAYLELMPRAYRGILCIPNVPGRSNIEVHTANYFSQLLGCLAAATTIGKTPDGDFDAVESRLAYSKMYPIVSAAIDTDGGAYFKITDTT